MIFVPDTICPMQYNHIKIVITSDKLCQNINILFINISFIVQVIPENDFDHRNTHDGESSIGEGTGKEKHGKWSPI